MILLQYVCLICFVLVGLGLIFWKWIFNLVGW